MAKQLITKTLVSELYLDRPLDDLIEYLLEIKKSAPAEATEVRVDYDIEYGYYDEGRRFYYIYYKILETDEEEQDRINKENTCKEHYLKAKKEEYLKLKELFESEVSDGTNQREQE